MGTTWLFSAGDVDILRETTHAAAIFWYRARRGWKLVLGSAVFTAVVVLVVLLLVLGPEGSGLWWATREAMAGAISVLAIAWLGYNAWMVFKFMPGRNDRVVLGLRRMVQTQIIPLEDQVRGLSDDGGVQTPAGRG